MKMTDGLWITFSNSLRKLGSGSMVDVIYGVIFPNLLTFWHALEFIICREITTQLLSFLLMMRKWRCFSMFSMMNEYQNYKGKSYLQFLNINRSKLFLIFRLFVTIRKQEIKIRVMLRWRDKVSLKAVQQFRVLPNQLDLIIITGGLMLSYGEGS